MNTPGWKETEVQPDFKNWLGFWEGCLMCACDHGCNQWVKEQGCRAAMLFRVISNPKATTKLDKITKIPLERINKIWYRLVMWDSEKFNRELRNESNKERR